MPWIALDKCANEVLLLHGTPRSSVQDKRLAVEELNEIQSAAPVSEVGLLETTAAAAEAPVAEGVPDGSHAVTVRGPRKVKSAFVPIAGSLEMDQIRGFAKFQAMSCAYAWKF